MQRMALRMIKDVVRLKWEGKLSHEQIARTLSVSKGVVSKYVKLAQAAGLDWEAVRDLDEVELQTKLLPRAAGQSRFAQADWGRIHQELSRKGVTLMLLWEEYVAANAHKQTWRYTQFCAHSRRWSDDRRLSMRQVHKAGEKLFVDYAGKKPSLVDPLTGEVREVELELTRFRGHLTIGVGGHDDAEEEAGTTRAVPA